MRVLARNAATSRSKMPLAGGILDEASSSISLSLPSSSSSSSSLSSSSSSMLRHLLGTGSLGKQDSVSFYITGARGECVVLRWEDRAVEHGARSHRDSPWTPTSSESHLDSAWSQSHRRSGPLLACPVTSPQRVPEGASPGGGALLQKQNIPVRSELSRGDRPSSSIQRPRSWDASDPVMAQIATNGPPTRTRRIDPIPDQQPTSSVLTVLISMIPSSMEGYGAPSCSVRYCIVRFCTEYSTVSTLYPVMYGVSTSVLYRAGFRNPAQRARPRAQFCPWPTNLNP